jgi:hypothetical protein
MQKIKRTNILRINKINTIVNSYMFIKRKFFLAKSDYILIKYKLNGKSSLDLHGHAYSIFLLKII